MLNLAHGKEDSGDLDTGLLVKWYSDHLLFSIFFQNVLARLVILTDSI